jgi:hypothetical protein
MRLAVKKLMPIGRLFDSDFLTGFITGANPD